MKYFILTMMTIFALTGCTYSAISKNQSFDSSSPSAILVIGVSGELALEGWFAKYDSETKKLKANSFSGHEGFVHNGGGKFKFKVISMDPGFYVLKNIAFHPGWGAPKKNICMSKQTYAFEIKAGEILYFGDILLKKPDNLGFSVNGDSKKAMAALDQYPNVSGDLANADLKTVSFENGEDIAWLGFAADPIGYIIKDNSVCGGYYKD